MELYKSTPKAKNMTMNKTDLIQKVKAIDGLTQDERAFLVNLVNTKKKYGLVWEDKPEEVEELLRQNLPELKEVKERAIPEKAKKGAPNHILIEGDNLHALTALSFTHEGKIDVIYIDPPYNTGNKDFKYNDSFVDKEDSYRHSKWLSFINKRLKIAKRLLSENGFIFISINDIENAQLKILCNEIFNEDNFISNIVWANKEGGGSSDSKFIRVKHEYILCYCKNKEIAEINGVEISNEDRYKREDEFVEIRGPYYTQKLGMGSIQYSESLDYPILCPDNTYVTPIQNNSGKKACWRWSKTKLEWGLKNKFIEFKKDKNAIWIVYTKQYLKCDNEANLIERTQRPFGLIENFSSTQASKKLEDIGLINLFSYSKPQDLIGYILKLSTKQNSQILDFFAGSGTTLHATMALNAEDGGNRKCILVTNNENNICEEVTYERNKRVIQGYTNAKGVAVEGLANNNLRYYKSDFVQSTKSETNKRLLTKESTDLLCIREDCFFDITDINGMDSGKCKVLTNQSGKYLIIVYHSRQQLQIYEQLIAYIKIIPDLTEKIRLYGFSPEKETLTEDFIEVADKIEAIPLPEAIYNAYRATFKAIKLDKKPPASKDSTDTVSENETTLENANQDEA
jgi:adenine-specific DNA-methyltransferase